MQSITLIALLVLIAGASAQCWGGNCGGGCFGNNCGPKVTVVSFPNNNGCSCTPCFGNGCAPRCSYCPGSYGYSSCCNNNNFSCCGFRFRRAVEPAKEASADAETSV